MGLEWLIPDLGVTSLLSRGRINGRWAPFSLSWGLSGAQRDLPGGMVPTPISGTTKRQSEKVVSEFPLWLSGLVIQLVSMALWVPSVAQCSELRIPEAVV